MINLRILAIADLHGKYPRKLTKKFIKKNKIDIILSPGDISADKTSKYIFKYWDKTKKLAKKNTRKNIIRDIIGSEKWDNLILQEVKSCIKILRKINSLNIPFIFVYGNGDTTKKAWFFDKNTPSIEDYEFDKLKNIKMLEFSSYKFEKYKIFGFGHRFTLSIKTKDYGKKIRKIEKQRLNNFFKKNKSNVILLTHGPPYLIFDKILYKNSPRYGQHVGDDILRKTIEKYQPLLCICGHMHEYGQRKAKIGKTLIVNPGYGKKGEAVIIDLPKLTVKFIKLV
ncbi:MAG: metallophosphoesterase [Candidatus Aenigmarchaeota archaeon]|nr:metallophosphoesterase [Candidatus Aenigmarchaeota archaeon]